MFLKSEKKRKIRILEHWVELHILFDNVLIRQGRADLGSNPQQNIAAKPSVLCCHLANSNEEVG